MNILHAESLASAFQKVGIESRAIHSKLKKIEQKRMLDDFQYGGINLLVSVDQLAIGFDAPIADTVVFARPTKSFNLYQQMMGRVLRPFENKRYALLLDCAGLIDTLGLPDKRDLPEDKKKYDLTIDNPNSYLLRKEENINIDVLYLDHFKNISNNRQDKVKISKIHNNQEKIIKQDVKLSDRINKHQKSIDQLNDILEPDIINPHKYMRIVVEQLKNDRIIQNIEAPKILKNIVTAKRSTKIILKIRDFLYKNYSGHCQICGFTFVKPNDGKNYFEVFNWGDSRIVDSKKILTSADSLCLCPNCINSIKWGSFEAKFSDKLRFDQINDIELLTNIFHAGRDHVSPKIFQELIEFNDMYVLEIMINNNLGHIYFTHEYLVQFLAYLQLEKVEII